MKFKVVIVLWLFFVASACSQNVTVISIPTASPTVPTPTDTATPLPTITPSPTATQFPPLAEKGPYLILSRDYEPQGLYIYDVDGHGRRIVMLPTDAHITGRGLGLKRIISPDGQWLAYYSGSVDDNILPVTLNLLNIKDGTTKKVADVMTEDYQQKLNNVADELKQLFPDFYKPTEDGKDWVSRSLINEFIWSIYSIGWSPDSHYLAFAGQIDGNSSDVYLLDMESGNIQRVEDSLQSVSSIFWSPDGEYIVFTNSEPGQIYTGLSLYAVKPERQAVKNLQELASGTWLGIGQWLSPNILLGADGTDTAGYSNLYTIDITTGQIRVLWADFWSEYVIDHQNKVMILNTSEFSDPMNFGLYYITFSGTKSIISDGLYWLSLFFRGGEQHRFLILGPSDGSNYLALSESTPIKTGDKIVFVENFDWQSVHISPDYSWLLMKNSEGFHLFDKNDELVRSFKDIDMHDLIWTPDSQGIFYSSGEKLYYLSLPDGKPIFVDKCDSKDCGFDFKDSDATWLP